MANGTPQEVRVPDIGSPDGIPVIEVLVAVGDTVVAEQGLFTLESDKATMELPAPVGGVVVAVEVRVGDTVSDGALVALIDTGASGTASVAPAPVIDVSPPVAAAIEVLPTKASAPHAHGRVPYASPAVRALARRLDIDLEAITGTGRGGRITRADVQNLADGGAASPSVPVARMDMPEHPARHLPWPSVDFARFGETDVVALSRIQRISGANLARNWALIPHVTQHDEADITDLESFRLQINREQAEGGDAKLTMLAFLMKACARLLGEFPRFGASLDAQGDNLIMKRYVHMGFAADTADGLVVPVIRDVDHKSVTSIARELASLAGKARAGQLTAADMQGGCFTISSLGGIGGTAFTPIINAPEVAILGVSRAAMKPQWDGQAFQPRLMLPLSLSYDHRVIDGAAAARFTARLGVLLADVRRMLL